LSVTRGNSGLRIPQPHPHFIDKNSRKNNVFLSRFVAVQTRKISSNELAVIAENAFAVLTFILSIVLDSGFFFHEPEDVCLFFQKKKQFFSSGIFKNLINKKTHKNNPTESNIHPAVKFTTTPVAE
jgi:hypothetical protein